jgi:hypothetical protein
MLTKLVLVLSLVLYLVKADVVNTDVTPTLSTIPMTAEPLLPVSDSDSESDSESGSDEGVGQYCPIVFDESMTECQKIQALLSVLESKRGGKEFCGEPKVWFEQLKSCCTTRYGMPDKPCVRNVEKVFDADVGSLLIFGDVQ